MTAPAAPTVVHAWLDSVERNPYGFAARVVEKSGEPLTLTHVQLHRLVAETAMGLAARGIAAGDRLLVALPSSRDLLAVYLAALYSGVVPLLLREPRPGGAGLYAAHLADLARATGARALVVGEPLAAEAGPGVPVLAAAALRAAAGTAPRLRAEAEGIAHLQSTSGSTGTPKLAVVRHRNITANVRAVGAAIGHRPDDVLVTWLPFSHDMGLIGLAYALLWQIPIVVCETTLFVQNPLLWPQWMSRFGGTLSPAPNSAFQMCARLARLRPPRGLNLAAWRVALCGAEPVFETTLQQFRAAFAPAGLRDTTVLPVYGLAEATLAVTISAPGAPLRVDRVDSDALGAEHRAVPRGDGGARSLAVVGVGRAIPGHHLRVVDADGRALPDRQVGEIEFAGPSVVDGYWSKPEAPAALRRPDGFLRTGDLGYLADGILYVTGRHKDLVIVGGRNYSPNQIEAFVENLLDSPVTPAVVAVGVEDPSLGTEQLHLLLDTRLAGGEAPRAVEERVRQGLEEVFGLGGTAVHWVTGGEIPRTHSGKVQRFLCRQLVDARSKGEPEWSLSPSSGSGAAFPAGSRIPDRSGPC